MWCNYKIQTSLKGLRRIINALIWTIAGLYLALVLLLSLPAVKAFIASKVSDALSEKLGTSVAIKSADISIPNRLTVNDVLILDQDQQQMLLAPRLSAKIKIPDLINGKITISSAQVFGLKANLYKKTADSPLNFQFVLDSLASKDTTKHTPLNLEISSLIIRRSEVAYNQLDDYNTQKFSTKHINISDISAHVILNKLTDDSLDVNIKRVSLKEKRGFQLKKLSLKMLAGMSSARLTDLNIELPGSRISVPALVASYETENKKLKRGSLHLDGKLSPSIVTLSDLGSFVSVLNDFNKTVSMSANIGGTDRKIDINNINVSLDNDLSVLADCSLLPVGNGLDWNVRLHNLTTSSAGIASIANGLHQQSIPKPVEVLGNVTLSGEAKKANNNIDISGKLSTAVGSSDLDLNIVGDNAKLNVLADALDLEQLTGNKDLGALSGSITADGVLRDGKLLSANGNADIKSLIFKKHHYKDIKATGDYAADKALDIDLHINDEACMADLVANYNIASKTPSGTLHGTVAALNPNEMGLTDRWGDGVFSFGIDGSFTGTDINNAVGNVVVKDLSMQSETNNYHLNNLELTKTADNGKHALRLKSDFASLLAEGEFNYETVANSITNAIYNRLPTLPGIKHSKGTNNRLNVYATINKSDWAQKLLGMDLALNEPAHLVANIDDNKHLVDITLDAADFAYNGSNYKNGYLLLTCPNDTMRMVANAMTKDRKSSATYTLRAQAIDNQLTSKFVFHSDGKHVLKGEMNAVASFSTNGEGQSQADVNIKPSQVYVNDSVWTIDPAHIKYYAKHLEVERFAVHHADQRIAINGKATDSTDDELKVELKDVNVSYILGLVNFHSVEFAGNATGEAHGRSLFGKPEADAKLIVKNFTFMDGRLGTLDAKANWNIDEGAINIDAIALDETGKTKIDGFVSPKNSELDLKVHADGTRLEFLEYFCDTFLDHVDVYGWGDINVVGPFKAIQLVGEARVSGKTNVTPLNTTYTIQNAHAILVPDDIALINDTIFDRDNHIGIVNGHLRHKHLGNFTYDIDIEAQNLLGYDTHDFGNDTFYGTAYVTGDCSIRGKSGEVVIDIDATPNAGSQIVYNAASPDAISNREFITWNDRNATTPPSDDDEEEAAAVKERKISSDLYLNFLIHCNPDATIRLLMDPVSGDYIALQGNGVLRAQYYDKGSFEIFGNYNVESGVYKLSIQNAIKRDFEFLPGGSIAFGGDAYNAGLNLQAQYTVNGVSLSDINIGKSFSNNNIRVDCLMNITGTPYQPRVDFSLDMPTVSNDAKQMVMSLMNSEEEIRQQVVYLLAVGRFLNQGSNNAYAGDASRQSQTSLAMQSILSGTISQELSSILDNIAGSNNWNFGANISTGDEGLYNAEYEGLVSGRLLNNRLIVNGQFGYRDNANATSSFIGDFDIRYLLKPSGNAAIKIYNQTNDKYFTKNSLNTQGVGLILKRDFNGWRDFFLFTRRKKNE